MSKQVEWRDIKGHVNYKVNSLGEVWSKDMVVTRSRGGVGYKASITGRLLKPWFAGRYLYVQLGRQGNKGEKNSVHRFVCSAFHGEPSKGLEVAHLDGVCTNNRPENLKWVTHKENISHMVAHGTSHVFRNNFAKVGEKKRGTKPTLHPQREEIALMRKNGASVNDVALFLGISKSGAWGILKNRMVSNA